MREGKNERERMRESNVERFKATEKTRTESKEIPQERASDAVKVINDDK